jgi:hypothetical protein
MVTSFPALSVMLLVSIYRKIGSNSCKTLKVVSLLILGYATSTSHNSSN